jgi:multiple sugar transport system ATP-binding protein
VASVELEHVDKVHPNGTRALVDLSFRIADGELAVVVGPSGSGKSTVLRLVAGLEEVTAGTVRIGERVVNALRPQERNVAMVFQDYALYPYLSARGNLEFPLRMRRLSREDMRQRVDRVAALLDIVSLLDRLPRQLSGGQRQRVAMGRALVREPTVFLLDEPLSNLDAKLRVQVRAEIKDLQRRTGTTMLYVTHDQVEAMTLGDRLAVLDRGRLQQVAPPREVYERPANAFVAGFIGNPPMNLFPTRLAGDGTLRLGGQTLPLAAGRARPAPGGALTAGVRPEAIGLGDAPGDAGVRGTVEHVESLGHETLTHVRVDGATGEGPVVLVARADGMPRFAKGDAISLRIDPGRVYLFGDDGRRLER